MEIIGLDIGGTKCAVCRADPAGRPIEVARFPTEGPEPTLARLFECIERTGVGPEAVFGISCGGPLDSRRGVILSPPNLPGWDGTPICRLLADRFGRPAYLMNDANACALAEWQFGAGRGKRSLVFLTAGTGMGAGLILDGRLYEGPTESAGEVGHMRLTQAGPVGFGKAGSFEGWCSGGGIARLARQKAAERGGPAAFNSGRVENIQTPDVARAAASGDPLAREVFEIAGRRLGQALAILIDLLNPEVVVLGGIYVRCRALLEGPMGEELRKEALPQPLSACEILPAELGEEIGNYAAICVARHRRPGRRGS